MIKLLSRRWLKSFSIRYQYDTAYMEDLLDHGLSAFLKYSTLNILASHRHGIPLAAWFAARIRAALWEDCGSCVQLVCNMALEGGVDADTIADIVALNLDALDEELALAVEFTELVLAHNADADALREQVRQRWGEDGLISLALSISTTRVYPSVKYVLGHGHACSRVQLGGRSIAPGTIPSATIPRTAVVGVRQ
jgi:hypothetical protein